jgi:hypothetical protein
VARALDARKSAEAALHAAAASHEKDLANMTYERDGLALRLSKAEAHAESLARANESLLSERQVCGPAAGLLRLGFRHLITCHSGGEGTAVQQLCKACLGCVGI